MQPEQIALINLYLQDETKLYQDWYATVQLQPTDPDTIPFGIRESLDELKQRFIAWWQATVESSQQKLKALRDVLCKKWLEMREAEKVHVLIALVLDTLAYLHLPHSPPVATILVTSGYLNKLCLECNDESNPS
jgi:hypothetical protein